MDFSTRYIFRLRANIAEKVLDGVGNVFGDLVGEMWGEVRDLELFFLLSTFLLLFLFFVFAFDF